MIRSLRALLIMFVLTSCSIVVFAQQDPGDTNAQNIGAPCQIDPVLSQPHYPQATPGCVQVLQQNRYFTAFAASPAPCASSPLLNYGSGTNFWLNPDRDYNPRIIDVVPTSTPNSGNNPTQSIYCSYNAQTGAVNGSGFSNSGTAVCVYIANHSEGTGGSARYGNVIASNCGFNTGVALTAQNEWGDANGKGTGTSWAGAALSIGNCVGSTDCATTYPNMTPMDLTSSSNLFYIPASGFSEGNAVSFGDVILYCGQNGNNQTADIRAGMQGCVTIRPLRNAAGLLTPNQYTIDTACTLGGAVTAFNFTTTALANNACGGSWGFYQNEHGSIAFTYSFAGETANATQTITLPTVGTMAGGTCTMTGGGGGATGGRNDAANLATRMNGNTMTNGTANCANTSSFWQVSQLPQCNTISPCGLTTTTTNSSIVSSGSTVTIPVTNSNNFAAGDSINISAGTCTAENGDTISSIPSGTSIAVTTLHNAIPANAGCTITDNTVTLTDEISCVKCNPMTLTSAVSMSGCTGCSGGSDHRANNAGVYNMFSYGVRVVAYTWPDFRPFFIKINDIQYQTSLGTPVAHANNLMGRFFVFLSHGPDLNCDGTVGTYGEWCWGDATMLGGGVPSDGTVITGPDRQGTSVTGSTPAPNQMGILGPTWSCANTANTACQNYDDSTQTLHNKVGLIKPCTSPCSPPANWVQPQLDLSYSGQNTIQEGSTTNPMFGASNEGAAFDNTLPINNVFVSYPCWDSGTVNKSALCYMEESGSTGQTIAVGFIDNSAPAANVLNQTALIRVPSGTLYALGVWQDINAQPTACGTKNPCMLLYKWNGSTWTETANVSPAWAASTAAITQSCTLSVRPDGTSIDYACFAYAGSTPIQWLPGSINTSQL